MNKNYIIIKIGGSLLFREDKSIDVHKIEKLCNIITSNKKKMIPLLVVGGGIIARNYIDSVRLFTENEALCDMFGIKVSRLNADLFISYLGDRAYPLVPQSIEDLSRALLSDRIVVMGGLQPGQSTTSVALEVGEYVNANKILILTNVDGIYDKDPNQYDNAHLLKTINYSRLTDLIISSSRSKQAAAGEYRIFDAVSLQILKRSKIEVMIGSGVHLNSLEQFWNGKIHNIGTIISD
jgi:uridylate kinase